MSIQLYKPNGRNTGAAFTFSIGTNKNSSHPAFYISAISQFGWDDSKKVGSFAGNAKDPEKTINVKINEFECGEILSAFKNRYDFSTFHAYEGNTTTIKFSPWDKDAKISKYDPETKKYKDSKIKVPAFGVTIARGGGNSFKIGMDPGEVEVLIQLIQIYLAKFVESKLFDGKKQVSEKRTGTASAGATAHKAEEPATETADEEEEEEYEDVPF